MSRFRGGREGRDSPVASTSCTLQAVWVGTLSPSAPSEPSQPAPVRRVLAPRAARKSRRLPAATPTHRYATSSPAACRLPDIPVLSPHAVRARNASATPAQRNNSRSG
ncbi:hypothetical protein K466DRAFT_607968 [Polyporus arcularius HHB13444]|uniref:Uncharacterized protein n=1 Tax=Polyporus arcularius HHB13444 TaxID=1314778 RepID=A0A5C3NK67_9APHY|nr:hypothetical protein K466DRAFT_607968 [Polyporus arcularius HHB13444]